MRGVSTKVGMIVISSKLLAYTALIKPAIENSIEVKTTMAMVIMGCSMVKDEKNNDTSVTIKPTISPRAIPPPI